jgi:hypothetical protein
MTPVEEEVLGYRAHREGAEQRADDSGESPPRVDVCPAGASSPRERRHDVDHRDTSSCDTERLAPTKLLLYALRRDRLDDCGRPAHCGETRRQWGRPPCPRCGRPHPRKRDYTIAGDGGSRDASVMLTPKVTELTRAGHPWVTASQLPLRPVSSAR